MPDGTESGTKRKVVAWVHMSMDGFTAAPNDDVAFLIEHATQEQTAAHFEGVWRGASTVVLGRTNFEGFLGFWPSVAKDPNSSPRDRDFATWLDAVEKVGFSRTVQSTDRQNARVASDLEAEVVALKTTPGRDILVLNSASIIQALLRSDLVDELRVNVLPSVLGGGLRLFSDDLPPSTWHLVGVTTFATGAVGLHYRRL